MTVWKLAQRARLMDPGILQNILRLAEDPSVISLAGGLPAAQTFPVEIMAQACEKVLKDTGSAALQYASGDGFFPLREWVVQHLAKQGIRADIEQVIITTGSQQGLDLVAKVLIDQGSRILLETPTYLGALQAFIPMEPLVDSIASDDVGPIPEDLKHKTGHDYPQARFMYVLPNFQNPSGRMMTEERRSDFVEVVQSCSLPIIEDNPYGDLWFDAPPPAPLTSHLPAQSIYLGSFSKILAPGLRLGYMVVPREILSKFLYCKMASDLHTPILNQRVAYEVIKTGFLEAHIPTIRALYKAKCLAMLAALEREMQGLSVSWTRPAGGMFLWLKLPEQIDTLALLPKAIEHKVAYVPGMAFFANHVEPNTMRLSFVTATFEQIDTAIAALAKTIRETLET